ncbi:hypothetical protein D910_05903 [Dendroctonus ponderosae]|uniref:Uncharacterized protein n=1 Tax=Dendroctonus ponderosae TaxID=77166 RepID=U4U618_DENPD|nr:hypothetical protein D910_05903 [Dendroctonus ponderosae]
MLKCNEHDAAQSASAYRTAGTSYKTNHQYAPSSKTASTSQASRDREQLVVLIPPSPDSERKRSPSHYRSGFANKPRLSMSLSGALRTLPQNH